MNWYVIDSNSIQIYIYIFEACQHAYTLVILKISILDDYSYSMNLRCPMQNIIVFAIAFLLHYFRQLHSAVKGRIISSFDVSGMLLFSVIVLLG